MWVCIIWFGSYLPVYPHSLISMQVMMTKYHNQRPQTHQQHYVEEAHNNSCHDNNDNQLYLHQPDDCKSG